MKKIIYLLLGAILLAPLSFVEAKDSLTIKTPYVEGKIAVPELANNNVQVNVPDLNGKNVYNDLKNFSGKYFDKADTLLTKGINKAGELTNEGWHILVRQQRVNAFIYLTLLLVELLLIYRWFKLLTYTQNWIKNNPDKDSIGYYILLGSTAVLIICLGIYNAQHLHTIYTGLFNPEYNAIKELVEISTTVLN